ncbi:hypothetical protein LG3211_4320 [Lysobacter gummosus]|nr:hypothetical protein LG3211_4320 [Lysobacter gummosus]
MRGFRDDSHEVSPKWGTTTGQGRARTRPLHAHESACGRGSIRRNKVGAKAATGAAGLAHARARTACAG